MVKSRVVPETGLPMASADIVKVGVSAVTFVSYGTVTLISVPVIVVAGRPGNTKARISLPVLGTVAGAMATSAKVSAGMPLVP